MPNKTTLIRPDGSKLEATAEQANKLKLLGYKEETPEEREAINREAGREEHYSSAGQKAMTAVEGIGRGASLGLTDYAFGDEHTAARAQYNPGTAMASEALGTIGPLLIPGAGAARVGQIGAEVGALGKVAALTPTAIAGRGARGAAEAVGLTGGKKVAAAAAIEGGIYGGAAAADRAYLSGDPLTSEAVLHGIGFGTLFGGGLGAIGAAAGKLGAKAEAAAAARVTNAEVKAVRGALEEVGGRAFDGLKSEVGGLYKTVREAGRTVDAVMSGSTKKIMELGAEAGLSKQALGVAQKELQMAQKIFNKALKKGNADGIELAQGVFEETINKTTQKLGLTATEASASLGEIRRLKTLEKELGSFPHSIEEFAGMSPQRAERLFATLDEAKKLSAFPVLGKAVDDAASRVTSDLGLAETGVDGLRKAWKTSKEALKQERRVAVPGAIASAAGMVAGGTVAAKMRMTGVNTGAASAAYFATKGLVQRGLGGAFNGLANVRNSVLGRLEKAAAAYLPKVGKATPYAAPKIAPLAVKLDGSLDVSSKDSQALAANRIREIMVAAPGIKDSLYKAVEPLSVEQPDLAIGLHKEAIGAFARLKGMIPSDPGVVSALKSIWRPSKLQAAVFNKQYEVFHDPVGVSERMLTSGNFDPIQTKALRELAPEVFNHLRVAVLEKVTMPGFLDKFTYRQQIGLGNMLDIAIHSSMRPGYIATSQQMFMNRNQPLATPAMPGADSGGGRPPGANPTATQSQRIEGH